MGKIELPYQQAAGSSSSIDDSIKKKLLNLQFNITTRIELRMADGYMLLVIALPT